MSDGQATGWVALPRQGILDFSVDLIFVLFLLRKLITQLEVHYNDGIYMTK